jgi:peptidoglycan/xylan/chitin deacetylase (PgdA/CDA1 family)
MGISLHLKSAVHAISYKAGLSAFLARTTSCARIMMYHGITQSEARDFEEQLQYLRQQFTIVSLNRLVVDILENATWPSKPPVAITFDDGLKNNYTTVYPILRRLNIPATFFVCPGLIEDSKWLWNHEARMRLSAVSPKELPALAAGLRAPHLKSIDPFIAWMKTLEIGERHRVEASLREETPNFHPSTLQRERYDIMNWEELRQLDSEMVTIGSHTVNHPILSASNDADLLVEIEGSRRMLESQLQRPVDLFCYPNGDYSPLALELVAKNYRAAVSTETSVVTSATEIFQLPRIPADTKASMTAWRMHRPTA